MKLLLDANLSSALIPAILDIYPSSTHVFTHGDIASDDAAIWHLAKREDFIIVTKDVDFLDLSLLHGAPPKVVLLRTGNVPTKAIEVLLRAQVERIARFISD